jgi:hypothetical protein
MRMKLIELNLIILYKDSRFHIIVSPSGVRAKLFCRALKTLLLIEYVGKKKRTDAYLTFMDRAS